ncbi:MAG: TetR family transcriptional regulator [Candidatus Promineifilaceae bacterium]
MRRTPAEAAHTRQELLDAALDIFSASGYTAARLETIAAQANATRGAIYHHFGSKLGLYQALLSQADDQRIALIQEAIDEGGAAGEMLRAMMQHTLELLAADARFRQITALRLQQPDNAPELAALAAAQRQQTAQLVTEFAAFLQQAGMNQDALPATTLAHAFLAYQDGVSHFWLRHADQFSLATEAAGLVDVFWHGMGSFFPANSHEDSSSG